IKDKWISLGQKSLFESRERVYISKIVFLYVTYEELERRIKNFATRGISKSPNQTFRDLYEERQILYKKYADITIDCNSIDQDEVAMEITNIYKVSC
ncbi:MAG: shikimate kinase, partial [Desulfamplus sp.]|nr:shikimate kinase [Desulfamplus sp.]